MREMSLCFCDVTFFCCYDVHQVGTAADTLSQSGTKLADDELIQLDEPLQEYVRLTASLKVGITFLSDDETYLMFVLWSLGCIE